MNGRITPQLKRGEDCENTEEAYESKEGKGAIVL